MLSKRLKFARKRKKLSQEELAKIVNTTKGTISNYENEYSTPSNEMLKELATVLDVTTDFLLGRTDNFTTEDFEPMSEINRLLKEFGIEQSGFHDIDRWKAMGPEEIKELEKYFKYITDMAKRKNEEDEDD
ncbi:helix-turn-helix domain-containing protein [Gracilibacillus marinus]|uniref:Helix-turn-helix domain-containing protein n=1 Tax=Gracilibacillus marinus TaxID=630535 RepID=A0ABV8VY69_9BACI